MLVHGYPSWADKRTVTNIEKLNTKWKDLICWETVVNCDTSNFK